MKNFIIGVVVGVILSGAAYAATAYVSLQSSNGQAITSSNPLPVQSY